MAVTIKNTRYNFTITEAEQMIPGRAYMEQDGAVYICNPYAQIMAFSICGRFIIHDYTKDLQLVEIDLEITVK